MLQDDAEPSDAQREWLCDLMTMMANDHKLDCVRSILQALQRHALSNRAWQTWAAKLHDDVQAAVFARTGGRLFLRPLNVGRP